MPSPTIRIRLPFLRFLTTRPTRPVSIASACFFGTSLASASDAAKCFRVTVGAAGDFAGFAAGMVVDLPRCVIAATKESCRFHKCKVSLSMAAAGDMSSALQWWAGLTDGDGYADIVGPTGTADPCGPEVRVP